MEATKVQVRSHTLSLAQKPLTQKKRRELRKQAIIEHIKSVGMMTPIQEPDFARVAAMPEGSVNNLLRQMVDEGLIQREVIGHKKICYTVQAGKIKVLRQASVRWTAPQLEELAKDFSWKHSELDQHNSLKSFIDWLKSDKKTATS
jgi:hypothetical protein